MIDTAKARWKEILSHPGAAILLGLIGFFAYTLMDAGGQILMMRGMPSGDVILGRCVSAKQIFASFRVDNGCEADDTQGINLILCLAYYLYTNPRAICPLFVPSRTTALYRARGFAGSTALSCGYGALSYLSLSEFLTALHLNPFPTALLCYAFLGEKSSKKQIVASGK